jgi:hypothetical protein
VTATLRPPTSGSQRWSCRELSAQIGVSEATVARVWREYCLAPRPNGEYAFTIQPELSASRISVIGLCVTRRVRAVALVIDDPRTGDWPPPHDEGTDRETGSSAPAATVENATKIGVRDFLRRVSESYPERAVHVVVDSAHLQRLLLQSVPQLTTAGVSVHFALDTEKWQNLVEVWFGLMDRDGLAADGHPASRVRELLTHGRTVIWVESDAERAPVELLRPGRTGRA